MALHAAAGAAGTILVFAGGMLRRDAALRAQAQAAECGCGSGHRHRQDQRLERDQVGREQADQASAEMALAHRLSF
jgi:hypothetical protein